MTIEENYPGPGVIGAQQDYLYVRQYGGAASGIELKYINRYENAGIAFSAQTDA